MLGLDQFQDRLLTKNSSQVRTSEDKNAHKKLALVGGASL
jgi:hypothetical protein